MHYEAVDLPQKGRKRPDQERNRATVHRVKPGVLKRSKPPFTVLAHGDEGLDRVAFGYRVGLAAHHRPAYSVHQGHIRAQEAHILDLPYQAAPLQPLIEELLVERSDLLSPFEVRAV